MEQPEDIATSFRLPEPTAQQERVELVPSGTPIFDVKNVSIYYSSFKAVADVSLSIYQNEITAFIGSSAAARQPCCGRSTA